MTGKRRALLLASNGPGDLSPLRFAVSDRNRFASVLQLPSFGFEVSRSSDTAPAKDIRDELEEFCQRCAAEDAVIVYFAGHGLLHAGSLRLLWHNTELERVLNTGIAANSVFDAMALCRAANKLLVLDCCHAAAAIPAGARDAARDAPPDVLAVVPVAAESFQLLLASGRLEVAREFERIGGGFLTQALCDELESRAELGHEELRLDAVVTAVQQRAAQMNRSVAAKERVPLPRLFGSRIGDFSFARHWDAWVPLTVEHGGVPFVVLPLRAEYELVWAIGKTPVTNAQYSKLVGTQPTGENFDRESKEWKGPFFPLQDDQFRDPLHPVVCVSHDEAEVFAGRLADSEGPLRTCGVVPTVIWEFAAGWRALNDPNTPLRVKHLDQGHFECGGPVRVDDPRSRPNALGVVDLLGNVWEWCQSAWDGSWDSPLLGVRRGSRRASWTRPILARITLGGDEFESKFGVDLRGGSFLDQRNGRSRSLRATEIPSGIECRHSDLGFRVAGLLSASVLPSEYGVRLRALPRFESRNE